MDCKHTLEPAQPSCQCNGVSEDRPAEEEFVEQLKKRSRRRIKLNVGGRHFVTSLTTLTADPNSMLAAMFSGRHKLDLDEDMSVFVDRNGDAFAHLLEWLRTGHIPPKVLESESERKTVLIEARYFQLEELMCKLEETSPSDKGLLDCSVIKLNVGGKRFFTTRTTLTSDSGSMLAAMFSGRHQVHRDENGFIFIDRDGSLFSYVLNWLRSRVIPPLDSVTRACLLEEARYFQLSELIAALSVGQAPHRPVLMQVTAEIFYANYRSSLKTKEPLVLSFVDLTVVPSMAGLNLVQADLRGSNLSGVCLQNANLEKAKLNGARLHEADLRNANLKCSCLVEAQLLSADLRRACLDRCYMQSASFQNADLRDASLGYAKLSHKTVLTGVQMQGARGLDKQEALSLGAVGI